MNEYDGARLPGKTVFGYASTPDGIRSLQENNVSCMGLLKTSEQLLSALTAVSLPVIGYARKETPKSSPPPAKAVPQAAATPKPVPESSNISATHPVTPTAGSQLKEQCTYHQYVNPGTPISDEITKLTGITNELLRDKPTEEEIFMEVQDFFEDDIVAGYNLSTFDVKFIQEYYGRQGALYSPIGIVDCITMARNLLTKDVDVENYTLKTVGDYYGLQFNAHSAPEDARTTGKLLQIFLKE